MGLIFTKTSDGGRKLSLWVILAGFAVLLGISIYVVSNNNESGLDGLNGKTKAAEKARAPIPIETGESKKSEGNLDAETKNAMANQIAKERAENGGYITPEREEEIRRKYEDAYENKRAANFRPSVGERVDQLTQPTKKGPTGPKPQPKEEPETGKYKTLAERLGDKANKGNRSQSGAYDFKQPEKKVTGQNIPGMGPGGNNTLQWDRTKNLLPLGTFIPCVLDGDVITTDLQSHVWGNVVLDTTFRRQLQLPKGLVKIRGATGRQPVQNVVDIYFDTMVFADGTELPISGYAYSAFDPRYPNKFRTRGIPGEMIVPPYYIKLQSLLYSAALGASDAYIQNYLNENTTTASTFTTVPTINPTTGQVSNQIQQVQGQPVNNQIGATIGLSAGQAALEDLVETAKKDLEKYRPYVMVEKGTPFYVQLDKTVDVGRRAINGTAIAEAEEAERDRKLGLNRNQTVYPPGDARAQYTGYDPSSTTSSGLPGASSPKTDQVAAATAAFMNQLQPNNEQAAAIAAAENRVNAARAGTGAAPAGTNANQNAALQQIQALLNQ